jgi:hypothetical protein
MVAGTAAIVALAAVAVFLRAAVEEFGETVVYRKVHEFPRSGAAGRHRADAPRRSFTQDANEKAQDPKTRELADDVMRLADAITYQVKHEGDRSWAWHSNAATHAALTEALRTWMDLIRPSHPPFGLRGRSDPPSDLPGLLDPPSDPPVGLLGRSDPPTLGRATARHIQSLKAVQSSGGVLPPGLLGPERKKEKKS